MNLETLSAIKLQTLLAKMNDAHNQAVKALIAAGYGSERGAETRARAAETGEPLACAFVEAADAFFAAVEEQSARQRWHGSDKPIRRRA